MATTTIYPATDALFQIGEPALPQLVEVIKENNAESLAYKNACYTVMLIFRERPQEGINYLLGKVGEAFTFEQQQRLLQAVEYAKHQVRPSSN